MLVNPYLLLYPSRVPCPSGLVTVYDMSPPLTFASRDIIACTESGIDNKPTTQSLQFFLQIYFNVSAHTVVT